MLKLTEKDADFIASLIRDQREGCSNAAIEETKAHNEFFNNFKNAPKEIQANVLKEAKMTLEEIESMHVFNQNEIRERIENCDKALIILMEGSNEG